MCLKWFWYTFYEFLDLCVFLGLDYYGKDISLEVKPVVTLNRGTNCRHKKKHSNWQNYRFSVSSTGVILLIRFTLSTSKNTISASNLVEKRLVRSHCLQTMGPFGSKNTVFTVAWFLLTVVCRLCYLFTGIQWNSLCWLSHMFIIVRCLFFTKDNCFRTSR